MKWWKRVLRKRLKKAMRFPQLGNAFMVGRFLYKLFVRSRTLQDTLRRGMRSRQARILLQLFGRLFSKQRI